jgi:hypothetical protein
MPTPKPATLPTEQIHAFWNEVEEQLRSRHYLQGDQPLRAILRYRNEIDRVVPIIYHREPLDVAGDIISGQYVPAERRAE